MMPNLGLLQFFASTPGKVQIRALGEGCKLPMKCGAEPRLSPNRFCIQLHFKNLYWTLVRAQEKTCWK